MSEPTSGSISLTVLLIAVLGPAAGQYALIVFAALGGALWPLATMGGLGRMAGALFLLRIVATAVILSGSAAYYLETRYGLPVAHGMAVVAFLIGALGNGWGAVFNAIRSALAAATQRMFAPAPAGQDQEKP